jgi:hypothetical protein
MSPASVRAEAVPAAKLPLAERLARLWCRLMHRSITRPVHGQYRCLVCLRQYPVCEGVR